MTWSHAAYADLAALVGRRTGMAFARRCESVELSMRRAMARSGTSDLEKYLALVSHDDHRFDDLVDELTVGETYFFREPEQFERIRREVLPEISRRRGFTHVVRAWSAGCATGEEAYSLAIVLSEAGLGYEVLASDLSARALDRARAGLFGEWSLRGQGAAAARPYLESAGKQLRICDNLRRRVNFSAINLTEPATNSSEFDLILCRNVLIYFDPETVGRVASRLYASLAPGGWLVTASSDPPLWDLAEFEIASSAAGLFYRRPALGAAGRSTVEVEESNAVEEFSWPAQHDESNEILSVMTQEVSPASTASEPDDIEAECAKAKSLANENPAAAVALCDELTRRYPIAPVVHYWGAMVSGDAGDVDGAIAKLRRAIFLDRTLAAAHFALATLLERNGDHAAAARSFRNVRDLCRAMPAEAVVPLTDGETAATLADAAAALMSAD